MTPDELETRLASLLEQAGQRHHAAYLEADGVDPEWALWYAGYLQAHLWDDAGSVPTRSRLVYLLIDAERTHAAAGSTDAWPRFYARHILADLHAGDA